MRNVLPARKPRGRPSWGLAACTMATLAPTVWLLWPQLNTTKATPSDVAFGFVFLIPQALAFLLSAMRHRIARTLTVVCTSLGLALSVLAVPLYLIGLFFIVQAAAATVIAARRVA